MSELIGIYHRKGSFSDRWLQVCAERGLPHICVDMFDDELRHKLLREKVSIFLCHPPMADRRTSLAAQAILWSCSAAGIRTFPGISEFWHFDDKISQKYIFEALDIPTPATHVFFDEASALAWVDEAVFPLVFKLRAGAGSINVSLLHSRRDAISRVHRMFQRGYPATDGLIKDLSTKVRRHRSRRDWLAVARRLPVTVRHWLSLRHNIDWERGYAYFQEFIPGNDHDTRVTIIGRRAFAFRRRVRSGDFRASGSGEIDYDPKAIDPTCIQMAFEAAHRMGTNCIAFDFVERHADGMQLIVEMSCAFVPDAVFSCTGHWTRDLKWWPGHVWPQDAILDDLLRGGTP